MSRRPDTLPDTLPDAPEGFFQLTEWRPAHDASSRATRARWRASLAVLGVRTAEVEADGLVALWREGDEALSESGQREREKRRKT
jgi:hypothetical protein